MALKAGIVADVEASAVNKAPERQSNIQVLAFF
jgi:hypothetical protein